jgi:hypothetical protein
VFSESPEERLGQQLQLDLLSQHRLLALEERKISLRSLVIIYYSLSYFKAVFLL